MIRIRYIFGGVIVLTAAMSAPQESFAQRGDSSFYSVRVRPAGGECSDSASTIGWIGYYGLDCNCSFSLGPDGPQYYEFRAEPRIGGVEAGSPADGRLRAGDVITAIDGYLITTREGGLRFARLTPDRPITLSVRRGGRELDVLVTPVAACFERGSLPVPGRPVPPTRPTVTPTPPTRDPGVPSPPVRPSVSPARPRIDTTVPAPPMRPSVTGEPPLRRAVPLPTPPRPIEMPSGWFGFSLECADCTTIDSDGVGVWRFSSPPSVYRVEPFSPAHDGNIRLNDVLTHINGRPLTSLEGGRLFGAVQPGDTVTFRIRRNNSLREVRIVATHRRWDDPPVETPVPATRPVTRFSGMVGAAHILVTGGPVTVNRTANEVVIQTADVTIRIRRTGGGDGESRR